MTDGRPEALSRGRDVEASLTAFLVVWLPVDTDVTRAVRDTLRQGLRGGIAGEWEIGKIVLAGNFVGCIGIGALVGLCCRFSCVARQSSSSSSSIPNSRFWGAKV